MYGESDRNTLFCMMLLASDCLTLKRYAESIAMFERALELWPEDDSANTMENKQAAKQHLGLAYRGLGLWQRSIDSFGTVPWAMLERYGALSKDVKDSIWALGDSFYQLKMHRSALDIYTRYVECVKGEVDENHPAVKEVEGWINDLNSLILNDDASGD